MDFFYPPELPITPYRHEISELLRQHQVVIIAGDTGSGKTTQLPKICLETFPEIGGLIGCTQPRRVAATSVAVQVRHELGPNGALVGSKIRFHDTTSNSTVIKFMTDGVLLAETKNDRQLRRYRVLIIDEAHERSLNIDFLLGYLKRLLPKRPDLKLVVTSATIDTELFSHHFDKAPVLRIEGRNYPVDMVYLPPDGEDDDGSLLDHCLDTVCNVCERYPPGDLLVFLPTEKDIRASCEILAGRLPEFLVLPLFGNLQLSDQQKVFKNHHRRKIVLATNVAETSVTVPGISYVVDTGLARVSSYNPRSFTTSLPVVRISQANCNQRAGRCGRVGPGICFRLFSQEDFDDRPAFATPEIKRSNLAEVILQMISLNLGDPLAFPFLEPPESRAVRAGYRLLEELGALGSARRLTTFGRIMAQLPIDPVISRVIIEANRRDCLDDITIIAAALAIQDPRIRPADKEQKADQAHQGFAHPHSDFFVLLTIWKRFHQQEQNLSMSRLRRFCRDHYLSFQRMREWLDLRDQLCRILKSRSEFKFTGRSGSYQDIHLCLLSGFFRNCARRKQGRVYQTTGNREVLIFPGSHQFLQSGDWILAGLLMETSRLYAMTVATIEPEWVETVASHFCTYSWTHIRWQKKTGRVVADESVSLGGLPLLSGRVVNYGRRAAKNRPEARRIFIQDGLVANGLTGAFPFLNRNQELVNTWRAAENRLRKRDVVIEEQAIYDFYARRLPQEIFDRKGLNDFIAAHGDRNLILDRDDILLRVPGRSELADYPQTLPYGNHQLRLSYCFAPGTPKDGVTVHLPVQLLDSVKPSWFEWLVPGLLEEKTTFLLKGLPKSLRKRLIPISQTVARLLDQLVMYQGDYYQELTRAISTLYSVVIKTSDWPAPLPDHLRMRFMVEDDNGKPLLVGRELTKLAAGFRNPSARHRPKQLSNQDQAVRSRLESQLFTSWDFDNVPALLPYRSSLGEIDGHLFAGLEADPTRQAVRVAYFSTRSEAVAANTAGTLYLFRLAFKQPYKSLKKHAKTVFSGPSTAWLTHRYGQSSTTVEALLGLVQRTLFGNHFEKIISQETYLQTIASVEQLGFFSAGREILESVLEVLRLRRGVAERIVKLGSSTAAISGSKLPLQQELENCLEEILPGDFLDHFDSADLAAARRYLKSLQVRTERAFADPAKDRRKSRLLQTHERNLAQAAKSVPNAGEDCAESYRQYRKLVMEYRISIFSPEIKTELPVSEKKLSRFWQELSSRC